MNEDNNLNLTPNRPYMVRAMHQWLEDNDLTVYLMVDATHKSAIVPKEFIQDGRIVLNIGSRATGGLEISNDFINFSARFGGVSQEIWVPMQAVMGIYAKENSQGMFFDPLEYENYTPDAQGDADSSSKSTNDKPRVKRENTAGLKIIK